MPRWTRLLQTVGPLRVLTGLGGLFVVIAAGRATLVWTGSVSAALDAFILIGVPGITLLYGRYWLSRSELRPDVYPRIVSWSLAGIGLMALVVGLIEINPAGGIDQPFFTPFIATALGSVGGLAIGVHEGRAISRARELERALDLLEKTERSADVGGWEVDVDTMEVFWTEHLFDILDVSYDEEPPLDEALDVYHEDDRPVVESAVEEALDSGDSFDVEARFRTDGGEVRWLRVQGAPETVGNEVVSLRGAAQDITERKRRERELEQYQALTEAASDVIVTIDEQSVIRTINPAVADVFGYDRDELDGEPLTVLMPDELSERHRSGIERYLETGERTLSWDYVELPGEHADGSELPLAISFSEAQYEGERFFTGIVRDITERKERELERERIRRRMELALEVTDATVWEWDFDSDSVTTHPDPHALQGTGHETVDDFLEGVHPEDRPTVEEALEETVETGGPYHVEYRVPDGDSVRWAEDYGEVLEAVDDGESRMIGVAHDVTERKKREQRLGELIDRLDESNERLEQFAYAASHDLQEPLRMVSSYLQLIERRYGDAFDEEGEEFLEFAIDGADRMREMIDGLLQYSRVETGGDEFEPVDLETVLDDVLEDLQVKIEESDAEVTAESLPRVRGDEEQLRQVFQNLVDNAIEYSGDEQPRVRIAAERTGPEWTVSVSDEGIGVDPGEHERIFEVFQRGHGGREYSGTGIGLALCERIIERHQGNIWVDSEPGEGSTFSFTLPAAE